MLVLFRISMKDVVDKIGQTEYVGRFVVSDDVELITDTTFKWSTLPRK